MKTINLKIELDEAKLAEVERKYFEENSYCGMFEMLLIQGLSSLNPQGVGMKDGRSLMRIQLALDNTKANGHNILNVESAEFDLIKKIFLGDDAKFHPSAFKVVCQFADRVEEATKDKEK